MVRVGEGCKPKFQKEVSHGQSKEKFSPAKPQEKITREILQGNLFPLRKRADDGGRPSSG
jgi:hypothetical protein